MIYSEGLFKRSIVRIDDLVRTGVPTAIPPTNRLAFIRLRLTQFATDGYSLALEDWACELLSAIRDASGNEHRLYRQAQLRWYAERVEFASVSKPAMQSLIR